MDKEEIKEFKEKTRRHLFNCELKAFPVVFQMYVMAFGLTIDLDKAMGEIISIIRTSENATTAFYLVCLYLDDLE